MSSWWQADLGRWPVLSSARGSYHVAARTDCQDGHSQYIYHAICSGVHTSDINCRSRIFCRYSGASADWRLRQCYIPGIWQPAPPRRIPGGDNEMKSRNMVCSWPTVASDAGEGVCCVLNAARAADELSFLSFTERVPIRRHVARHAILPTYVVRPSCAGAGQHSIGASSKQYALTTQRHVLWMPTYTRTRKTILGPWVKLRSAP